MDFFSDINKKLIVPIISLPLKNNSLLKIKNRLSLLKDDFCVLD